MTFFTVDANEKMGLFQVLDDRMDAVFIRHQFAVEEPDQIKVCLLIDGL